MVELTFTVVPPDPQVAPVMLPELPPLLLLLPDDDVEGDDEVVPPDPDLGIEHSFTDFDGFGSEPKVATEQEKLPLKILYTNLSAAPNATLVEPHTEQVCPVLQIVVYPSGRLEAENALAAQPSNAVVIKIFFSMISISSVIGNK